MLKQNSAGRFLVPISIACSTNFVDLRARDSATLLILRAFLPRARSVNAFQNATFDYSSFSFIFKNQAMGSAYREIRLASDGVSRDLSQHRAGTDLLANL
jgi:hypothetical protein